MLLEEKIRESAESLRSLHTSRLAQCRSHAETLQVVPSCFFYNIQTLEVSHVGQVQARNQSELAAMEKDAREIMDAKLRAWDAELQRWRNTVHVAASQLPPMEESYRIFQAKIAGGVSGLAVKAAPAGGRGEAMAAVVREGPKQRGLHGLGDDRPWPRGARGGCAEPAERRGASERFHPYASPLGGQTLSTRQSMLRDMALKEAQQQLEQEGVLPMSDLYKSKALSRDVRWEDLEALERAAAPRLPAARTLPPRSSIPLGLPCSSSAMPLMAAYKPKGEKDALGAGEAGGLVGGWGVGVGGAGRVTDLWCSQFFAGEPALGEWGGLPLGAVVRVTPASAGAGAMSQGPGGPSATAVRVPCRAEVEKRGPDCWSAPTGLEQLARRHERGAGVRVPRAATRCGGRARRRGRRLRRRGRRRRALFPKPRGSRGALTGAVRARGGGAGMDQWDE